MKKVIILGGAGDGIVAAQVISDMQKAGLDIELVGYLNDHVNCGDLIYNKPVLGKTSQWQEFLNSKEYYFHPALHKVKLMRERAAFIIKLMIPQKKLISIIHPTAVVSSRAQINPGSLICSHVTIQPNVSIGAFNSIRAGASIGHDVITEDFCYIGPNSTITGNCLLKKGVHLGPNAVVTDRITLEDYSIAGAGAVIMRNTMPQSIYMGNPARKISNF